MSQRVSPFWTMYRSGWSDFSPGGSLAPETGPTSTPYSSADSRMRRRAVMMLPEWRGPPGNPLIVS
jgi:hypothetical protein